jgi:uncharacterized protein YbbC (DUF1343 family)
VGLLETTNLSVGRGTDTPFEVIGAPWLDGRALANGLNRASLPGVSFAPLEFTPDASKFAGERCSGVRLTITNRAAFEPLQTGLQIARQLALAYPDTWEIEALPRLLGNDATERAVADGLPYVDILAAYAPGLDEFRKRRAQHLIYR